MLYGIVVPSLMGKRFRIKILGGGFKCFIYVFTPKVGEDFQSDEYFFFRWVGSTTNSDYVQALVNRQGSVPAMLRPETGHSLKITEVLSTFR